MNNKELWNKVKQPPESALKKITGGRLAGKTDISPQWRYECMTDVFGVCGYGWKFVIDKIWTEPASDGQVFAFVQVLVYIKQNDKWSEPIYGIGGSMLIEKERTGLHANDEAFKMATTDALGTAMKMIGVASDVYMGKLDGGKYSKEQDVPIEIPLEEDSPDVIKFCKADLQAQVITLKAMAAAKKYVPKKKIEDMEQEERRKFLKYLMGL